MTVPRIGVLVPRKDLQESHHDRRLVRPRPCRIPHETAHWVPQVIRLPLDIHPRLPVQVDRVSLRTAPWAVTYVFSEVHEIGLAMVW
jgi:hypothetical protein